MVLKILPKWKERIQVLPVPSEGEDRDHDLLGFNGLQVRLRQQAYRHAVSGLSEDNGVLSQSHGTGFKAIAVDTYWDMVSHSFLVAVAKAKKKTTIFRKCDIVLLQ